MNILIDSASVCLGSLYVALSLFLHEKIKKKYDAFVARKILHILVGNAILIPLMMGASVWAVILPSIGFMIFNIFLIKKGFWKDWEGIMSYPISVIVLASFGYNFDFIYFFLPVFILAYGDAFASLMGKIIFKSEKKSLQGSLTMFLVSFAISLVFLNPIQTLVVAIVATLAEGSKWDNLTVPFAVAGTLYLIL